MPVRTKNRLTAKRIDAIKDKGVHADGGGLYLRVREMGTKSWVLIEKHGGRRRERVIGNYPEMSLAKARDRRDNPPDMVDGAPTFESFSTTLIDSLEKGFKNEHHRKQWRNSLKLHASTLMPLSVDEIATKDVLAVLQPIWGTIPDTADKLRGRIERVLDAARASGFRKGENPARWRGHLQNLLPKRRKLTRGHHPSMPHEDVGEFCRELQAREAASARCLEFLILTAARSGEALGALKAEIDRDKKLWLIPGARMKAGKDHEVPLSPRAMEIVDEMWDLSGDYLFPGNHVNSLSSMAMDMLLRRMSRGEDVEKFTVHGFRSTFKQWARGRGYADDLSEEALAHTIGSSARRAYARGEMAELRRPMMVAWAEYLAGDAS